jgi:hypothetical protein
MFCDALAISLKCQQLIRVLEQVSWKKDATGNDTSDLEKSNPMHTHTGDALGDFVAQRFPMSLVNESPLVLISDSKASLFGPESGRFPTCFSGPAERP